MKELLLLLSMYPFRKENVEKLGGLLTAIEDWNQLVQLINEHGIIAFAAYNIREADLSGLIPKQTLARIENGYIKSIVRNSWLTERWKEVNFILSEAGIKHILLKGMALEHTIYESKGLRQMNDVDIFLKKHEAVDAWSLLQKNGFISSLSKSFLHEKIGPEIGKHLPALIKDGFAVEIHTRLFEDDSSETEYESIFNETIEINIQDKKACILNDAIHLKYLINHYNRHLMEGRCQIRLFNDIKMLDPGNSLEFPESFILNPSINSFSIRKKAYRSNFYSIPARFRLQFLIGDIFPSIEWMKHRYGCNRVEALFHYPQRIMKIIYLL